MSEPRYVRRFDRIHSLTHIALMVSFLGLAATGMPLLFSEARWAYYLSRFFGGFETAGTLHRFFGTVLIIVFVGHIARFVRRVVVDKDYSVFWGPTSMVPQPQDLKDLYANFLWFVGRGPRPTFDRFTYWEKFDYWAVFWGMFVIGGSGIMLWFPTFFARFVPGWIFNIALFIHGEEALLAAGFIFTVHFFNGHIRPEKFPMDLVIFTGRMTRHEFEEERGAEFARLKAEGRLDEIVAPAPTPGELAFSRAIGTFGLVVGVVLVILIFYAVLT